MYPIVETPPLKREPSPTMTRGSPRMFRVQRVSRAPQTVLTPPTPPPVPKEEMTTRSVVVKDTMNRRTTPPPSSFFDRFPADQSVHYPSSYQTRTQQGVSTVHYQTPTPQIHQRSETIVQQLPQTNTSTTTKTSTRILDATTIPSLGDDSIIEETKTTTTVIRPLEIPAAPAVVTSSVTTVPQVTTVAPVVDTTTTTIRDRPMYRTRRRRRIRTISTSPFSDYTTSSTSSYTTMSTVTPPPHYVTRPRMVLPPRPPIQTTIIDDPPTTIVPERRYIHRARRTRTYSGYYSSDLDHGKRKVYKSDYKYRHYYYCNWCKGRCDLPNKSCGCCEWFYGCPVWALILAGLLFLALLITFFTLLGLQPTINPTRRSETAETRVVNRTRTVFGFLQNCGSSTSALTTLALCANTQTTSTSVIVASSSYTLSSGITNSLDMRFFIFSIFFLFVN